MVEENKEETSFEKCFNPKGKSYSFCGKDLKATSQVTLSENGYISGHKTNDIKGKWKMLANCSISAKFVDQPREHILKFDQYTWFSYKGDKIYMTDLEKSTDGTCKDPENVCSEPNIGKEYKWCDDSFNQNAVAKFHPDKTMQVD
jgi:hypothetical protein